MTTDFDYGDETYIDAHGTTRCDNCEEPVDECDCQCATCGDRVHTECPFHGDHPEED